LINRDGRLVGMSYEKLAELKARWLPVYLILLVVVVLLVIHFVVMYFMTGNAIYANLAVLTGLAIYFFYVGFDRLRKMKIERKRLLEVISCSSCGFREERDHEVGDYVFKEKGPCPKCGAPLLVTAIFSVVERR